MRKCIFFSVMMFMVFSLFSQVMIDDFEGYTSSAELLGAWGTISWPTVTLVETGGADGTDKYVNIIDGGWGSGINRTIDGIVPEDGNYKVTFYYQNGHVAERAPVNNLEFRVVYGGSQVKFDIPNVETTGWVAAETPIMSLTGITDLTIELAASHGATQDVSYALDEIYLEAVAEVPISGVVRPLTGYIVGSVQTITVTPAGGSGTFVSVGFDIGDNDVIDYTDSEGTDVFSYAWDTTAVADGPIDVKVIITDDTTATGEVTVSYTVSNTLGGRVEYIVNGGFEDWTGDYPEGWIFLNQDGSGNTGGANATVTRETVDVIEGDNALKVTFAAADYTYRYTMMSNSFPGNMADYILWFWGKGSSVRMFYFSSVDGGTTWINTFRAVNVNASVWTEVKDATPYNPGVTMLAVATHVFAAGDSLYDNVSVTASAEPDIPTHASSWDLFY